jgi:hypothetical protein
VHATTSAEHNRLNCYYYCCTTQFSTGGCWGIKVSVLTASRCYVSNRTKNKLCMLPVRTVFDSIVTHTCLAAVVAATKAFFDRVRFV